MRLYLTVNERVGEEILLGHLHCSNCGARYLIDDGIARLLPLLPYPVGGQLSKYQTPAILFSYLWSHYAELFADTDVTRAYSEWAAQIQPTPGIALDTGCAVGRFTFELSCKTDLAVGLDNCPSFIQTARELLASGNFEFPLVQEGQITEDRIIHLPQTWDTERIEFIVGDAQALPFPKDIFSCVASLNLVDKIPRPLTHIIELNRVAAKEHSQLLVSDPFSWSTDVADETEWLGGLNDGVYAGRGLDNIIALLEGKNQVLVPSWTVMARGSLWWKIRNHSNHYELIRSSFVKAVRPQHQD